MKNLAIHDIEKLEELPRRSNISMPDGGSRYRRKGNNYSNNKVRRFLKSRIGRNWDVVFSEYVHLPWIHDEEKTREHIEWDVVTNTFIKDGKIWFYEKFGGGESKEISEHKMYASYGSFYVHPKTKKLCFEPKKKRIFKEEEATRLILGDYHQLVKIKGIWREIKGEPIDLNIVEYGGLYYRLKDIPTESEVPDLKFFGRKVIAEKPKYMIYQGKMMVPTHSRYYCGPHDNMVNNNSSVKITVNRQLNSKELKRYGLKNEPIAMKEPCPICGNMQDRGCYHNKS